MKIHNSLKFCLLIIGILNTRTGTCAMPAWETSVTVKIFHLDTSIGLKVGMPVFDVIIPDIINYTRTSAKISDFRGKLLILDFWATWCSPCVAMIPKLDVLQKQFKGKVQFLPVNNQDKTVVVNFLNKLQKIKPFDLPDVLSDSVLNKMFPHTYLPHFVWIDPSGKVLAITSDSAVNEKNIQAILAGQQVSLKTKSDKSVDGDPAKVFAGNSGYGEIKHKLVPGYQEDLPSQWVISPGDSTGKSIVATNLLLEDLYNIALGEGKVYYGHNRVIYDVKDTSVLTINSDGQDAIDWMSEGHVYSYEVKTPPGMGTIAYQIMLQDLNKYFTKYNIRLEQRQVTCLALVRTSNVDKIHSKGGKSVANFDGISCHMVNFPLSRLQMQLSTMYLSKSPYPVIDQTGYKDWVDIDINARLSDTIALNKELAKYDLELKRVVAPLQMLVISDRLSPAN